MQLNPGKVLYYSFVINYRKEREERARERKER